MLSPESNLFIHVEIARLAQLKALMLVDKFIHFLAESQMERLIALLCFYDKYETPGNRC